MQIRMPLFVRIFEWIKDWVQVMIVMREIPILYQRKEDCCGCTACKAICPKEAISMVEDEEGFAYPQIEESKCIRCYKCVKVCPIKDSKG